VLCLKIDDIQRNEYYEVTSDPDLFNDKQDKDNSFLPSQSKQDKLQNILSHKTKKCKLPVWFYFDEETPDNSSLPVCKVCNKAFSLTTSTSMLSTKVGQKLINPNSYPEIEQQERDNLVVK
ncbi:32856_t:CDS:2, partial [Gigaspora margarita]